MIKVTVPSNNNRALILKRWLMENIGPETTAVCDPADDTLWGEFWSRGAGWYFCWKNDNEEWDIYFDDNKDALLFQLRWS